MVAVPQDRVDNLLNRIEQIRADHQHQAPEIKFSALHDRPRGRRILRDLAEYMDAEHMTVFFAAIEKRFLAASLVIETFLDPKHNPEAPPEAKPELRQELAALVLDVWPDRDLSDFVVALRQRDREAVRNLGARLVTRLDLHPSETARFVGSRIRTGLSDFFWPADAPGLPPRAEQPNPLVHAFLPFLGRIQAHLVTESWSAEIVADQDAQFGAVLDAAFDALQNSPEFQDAAAEFGVGGALDRITGYRRADHRAEPLLQIADLAAGIIRHVMSRRLRDEDVLDELETTWARIHQCMLRNRGHSFMMLSKEGWARELVAL